METTFTERDIQVTSIYFSPNRLRFESFPRKLVYKGREYELIEKR